MAHSSVQTLELGASILPVYEKPGGHARMHYNPNRGVAWDISHSPETSPLRVLKLGDYDIQLRFSTITWTEGNETPDSVVLQGHFQSHDSSAPEPEPCTEDVRLEWPTSQFQQTVRLVSPRKYLPWGLRGKICWSLVSGNGERVSIGESPLEVYFVADSHLKEPLYRGIPVDLFRKFLLPLRLMLEDPDIGQLNDPIKERTIGDDEKGWLVYVIEKLHYQKNMWYNSFHGGSNHYYNGGDAPLHLDHWVDDCLEKGMHLINCYDLAALADVIVRLGLQSPDALLRMKRMDPFGFINQTYLIGRGISNSPLADKTSEFLEENANSLRRTGFGSHVFMTIAEGEKGTEMALDATCRPLKGGPHAGRETLGEYIDNSIDATTDLYHAPEADLKKAHRKRLEVGTLTDTNPKNWPGVTQLWTEPEIYDPDNWLDSSVSPDDNVLANVASLFRGWDTMAPNIQVKPTHITAIWSITKDNESLYLQIARCATKLQAQALFGEAEERLKSSATEGVVLTDGSSNVPEGIKEAWGGKTVDADHRAVSTGNKGAVIWTQGGFFVQMTKDTQDDLVSYVGKLVHLINSVKDAEHGELVVNGEAKGEDGKAKEEISMEVPVGQTFEIKLSGFPQNMVPTNVHMTLAKVLFLSSSKSGDTVTFKFLARATTEEPDVVSFTRFDANMYQYQVKPEVLVTIQ